jgi:arylsulfatase A-like enzyme
MNTPFKWAKQIASHYGGVRNPMIISWPKRIKENVQGQVSILSLYLSLPSFSK